MSDYRVSIKIQNGRIWEAMKALGIENASQLAKRAGISPSQIGLLLNLRVSPFNKKTGMVRITVKKIADALGVMPEEMFTDTQGIGIADNVRHFMLAEHEVKQIINRTENEPERLLELKEVSRLFEHPNLTRREKYVLHRRFVEDKTVNEVGKEMNVSGTRVRQIEAKALRKIRGDKDINDFSGIL